MTTYKGYKYKKYMKNLCGGQRKGQDENIHTVKNIV